MKKIMNENKKVNYYIIFRDASDISPLYFRFEIRKYFFLQISLVCIKQYILLEGRQIGKCLGFTRVRFS